MRTKQKTSYSKEYYRKNMEQRKANSRAYFNGLRVAVLQLMGGKCKRCGFSDFRALQIDHVNGSGTKDRKSITVGYSKVVIESIRRGEKKYQLLCANCNWIKRNENSEIRK